LLGSGGREHALAWKLAQSRFIAEEGGTLYASPGNPGIAEHAELIELDATDHAAVAAFCAANGVDFVIVGPEAPLVDGLADSLREEGIAVFGPSKAAAQLEGSKGFTKDLCARAGIPTAGYVRATSLDEALAALRGFMPPFVLKADGLAAGKGVIIAETLEQAEEALADMFAGAFGAAGTEVVIEEFMEGEEATSPSPTGRSSCPSAARRITSGSATATPGRTRAAWAPTARLPFSPRKSAARRSSGSSARP